MIPKIYLKIYIGKIQISCVYKYLRTIRKILFSYSNSEQSEYILENESSFLSFEHLEIHKTLLTKVPFRGHFCRKVLKGLS